jgi:hypothetical protein
VGHRAGAMSQSRRAIENASQADSAVSGKVCVASPKSGARESFM